MTHTPDHAASASDIKDGLRRGLTEEQIRAGVTAPMPAPMPTDDATDYDEPTLSNLTVAELKERAEALGIDLDRDARKDDIIEAIEAAEADD